MTASRVPGQPLRATSGDVVPPLVAEQPTSVEAAVRIMPVAKTRRAQVLDYLHGHGPATDQQIAYDLDIDGSTARPRRRELGQAGLVVADGTARTLSGRRAILWRAVAGVGSPGSDAPRPRAADPRPSVSPATERPLEPTAADAWAEGHQGAAGTVRVDPPGDAHARGRGPAQRGRPAAGGRRGAGTAPGARPVCRELIRADSRRVLIRRQAHVLLDPPECQEAA